MSNSWGPVVEPPRGVSPELPPVVVNYTALVGLELERSNLTVASPEKVPEVVAAVTSAPEFSVVPWSAAQAAASQQTDPARSLETFALAKLRALLDFNAELGGTTSDEIRAQIEQRWPAVAKARGRGWSAPANRYNRVQVEAFIRADGASGWGYTVVTGGLPLPGFEGSDLTAVGDIDRYLQNMIRAEIADRQHRP